MGGKNKLRNLSESEVDFIKNNYNKMLEMDIAEKLKISRFHVQKIKREYNLSTYPKNALKSKGKVIRIGYFDYDKCWII